MPKVRDFLERKAFGETGESQREGHGQSNRHAVSRSTSLSRRSPQRLRALVVEELVPRLEGEGGPLSGTEPFPFSRPTFEASKTIFNLVAADNEFERDFAHFLQDATDVRAFAKLPQRFGFAIEYTDSATNLRYYEPDFVAVGYDDTHHLIETKGREDIDVAHKDRAALIWCESATLLTGTAWRYVKVPQTEFSKLQASELTDIRLAFAVGP